ncbi:MAG: YdcF family protein [Silvibacterium sp.]
MPASNLRPLHPPVAPGRRRGRSGRVIAFTLLLLLIGIAGWTAWVYNQILSYANRDDARPADAIAVFGAAEYDGRPSPVLRARLDHALALYQEKLAPIVVTLGGGDPADLHSEGGVGHDYLLGQGVPERAIIAETESRNTEQSARRLAVIADANHLRTVVVVSDGTHLFRIHALCESLGLTVFTSPRSAGKGLGRKEEAERIAHEILSYSAWRLRRAAGLDRSGVTAPATS